MHSEIYSDILLEAGANKDAMDCEGLTPLLVAAEKSHLHVVNVLLAAGADATLRCGRTDSSAVGWAAYNGNVKMLKAIVEYGVHVDSAASTGITALHEAVRTNQLGAIRCLIELGANPNVLDNLGRTPLHWAAGIGHTSAAQLLVAAGAKVNAAGKEGSSPLHEAAEKNRASMINVLLRAGAKKESLDILGRTPLCLAAEKGSLLVVQALLSAGARSARNSSSSHYQAMTRAACHGHEDVVRVMIEHGVDVNAAGVSGVTALHEVARAGQVEVVDLLIGAGADAGAVDSKGRTPLHWAAGGGHYSALAQTLLATNETTNAEDRDKIVSLNRAIIKKQARVIDILLGAGASKNVLDWEGLAPIHWAAEKGNLPAAQALLTAGADVSLHHGRCEDSAIVRAARRGQLEILFAIIRHGADVNATGASAVTALHQATRKNQVGAIDMLLQAGANVDALDTDGRTPLHWAVDIGHLAATQALLAAGADATLRRGRHDDSAMSWAASKGHEDLLQAVIRYGVDVNAAGISGVTALHQAVRKNQAGSISILINAGANLHALDHRGRAPLHWAAGIGQTSTMLTLMVAGADANASGQTGITALHDAARKNQVEAIECLLAAGAKREFRDAGGSTSLHWATKSGHLFAVRALLDAGAYVNTQNNNGFTPLHRAAAIAGKKHSAECVDILLRSGSDETMVDNLGQIAADMVGQRVEVEERSPVEIERVRLLLANARADKAWRRRGFLVLCRAFPERTSSPACGASAQDRTESEDVELGTIRIDSGSFEYSRGSSSDSPSRIKRNACRWEALAARLLELPEEEIFRNTVTYL